METIKVGIFNVEPFSYINPEGEMDGVTYKFLRKLEEETQFKFVYTILPYARVVGNLKDGVVDLAMFYPSHQNNGSFIKLTQTIGNDNIIVLRTDLQAKSLADVKGLSIARIRGGKYFEDFDNNELIKKVDVVNYSQSISLFLGKRVDGFIIPRVALNHLLKDKKFHKEDFKNTFFVNHKYNFIHVRNNLPVAIRNKIVESNKAIIKKYQYKRLEDLL